MMLRAGLAVVLAGVAGTLANAAAAALLVNPALWILAEAPGRYAVAILLVAAVPLLDRLLPRVAATALALTFLTLAPSLLAKLVLGMLTAWPVVLGLNLVFALAALGVYRLVAGSGPAAAR